MCVIHWKSRTRDARAGGAARACGPSKSTSTTNKYYILIILNNT